MIISRVGCDRANIDRMLDIGLPKIPRLSRIDKDAIVALSLLTAYLHIVAEEQAFALHTCQQRT